MLPIDELNTLEAYIRITMQDEGMTKEQKKSQIRDEIEDFLILCYLEGVERTEENFGKEYVRDDDKMLDAMLKGYKRKDSDKALNFVEEIDGYIENGDIHGVNVVAETNMTRLYSTGAYDAAEQFGGGVKVWQTMQDDRVRETHEYLQSTRVDYDRRFYTFDGDSARFPGDFTNPANNVNCRCWIDIIPE